MNIEELMRALPSRDDIANAIDRQVRGTPPPASIELMPALGIFSTGLLLGAGLALLFAPRPGAEVRHDIADKAGQLGHQARHLAVQAGEQAQQLAGDAADRGRVLMGQAAATTHEAAGRLVPEELNGSNDV